MYIFISGYFRTETLKELEKREKKNCESVREVYIVWDQVFDDYFMDFIHFINNFLRAHKSLQCFMSHSVVIPINTRLPPFLLKYDRSHYKFFCSGKLNLDVFNVTLLCSWEIFLFFENRSVDNNTLGWQTTRLLRLANFLNILKISSEIASDKAIK